MAEMMKKPITLDVNHMMADTLGFQYGIARSQVEEYAPFAAAANQAVQAGRGKNWLGWTELPYNQARDRGTSSRRWPSEGSRELRHLCGAGHRRQRPGPHRRCSRP